MYGFIGNNSSHCGSTPETNGLWENSVHRCRHMTHVVLTDLAGTVRQSVREHTGGRIQQQAWALYRVTSYGDNTCLLHLLVAILIGINYASYLAFRVMLNLQDLSVRPHLKITSRLTLRDIAVSRGPLRAEFTSLKTKTSLLAIRATISGLTIDGHPARVNVFIAKVFCASLKHFIVIISW